MRKKIKLLVVTNMYPSPENAIRGIFVKEQVQKLRDHGEYLEVDLLLIQGRSKWIEYPRGALNLGIKIFQQRPDIIHVHYGLTFLALLPWLIFIRSKKIKVVTTFHGSDVLGNSRLVRMVSGLAVRCSDTVIGVSQEIVNQIQKHAARSTKTACIPCGVDEELFHIGTGLEKTQDEKAMVLFPSNPNREEKDHPRFEEIYSRIAEQLPAQSIVKESLHGVSRDKVPGILRRASCVLLTSRREGSPQVVKEAVFCGTPVISTAVGDVEELLSGIAHCSVSNSNTELVDACVKAIKSRHTSSGDVAISSEAARQRYSGSTIAKELIKIYQKPSSQNSEKAE